MHSKFLVMRARRERFESIARFERSSSDRRTAMGLGEHDLDVEQIRSTLAAAAPKLSASWGRVSGAAPVAGLIEPRNQQLILLKGRILVLELRARTGYDLEARCLPDTPTAGELATLGIWAFRRAAAAMTARATSALRTRLCRTQELLQKDRPQ